MKRGRYVILLATLFLSIAATFVVYAASPLPLDQAFRVTPSIHDQKNINLYWQVAPGYYLYTGKFQFETTPAISITPHVPQGEFKYDPDLGRQEVVTGHFTIPLDFDSTLPVQLTVHYQGCSHDGFCYPPTEKRYQINFTDNTIKSVTDAHDDTWFTLFFDQEKIKQYLETQTVFTGLLLFFGFGLLLALTPCVLPMLPILSSIIIGSEGKRGPARALLLSFLYVLGSAFAYALIGFLAASLGRSLQVALQTPLIIASVSFIFLLLAAINFGWINMVFPRVWQQLVMAVNHRIDGGSLIGIFFMGVVSTCVVSPCITAPLLGVLLYIAQTGNQLLGTLLLFSMGMGLGLPLLIAGTSLNYILPRGGPWLIAIKHVFGFIMLGMSIWLMASVIHPVVSYVLSAILLLVIAIYIVFLLPRYVKHPLFCAVLGVLVASSGFYVMFQKAPMWLQRGTALHRETGLFLHVRSEHELDAALQSAKKEHKPVLIDFFAEWCTACVIMEKKIFSSQTFLSALKGFYLVRVDLTNNTDADRAMMQRFNVLAPPTFLLFDRDGRELAEKRIVGEVEIPFFLKRLNEVK